MAVGQSTAVAGGDGRGRPPADQLEPPSAEYETVPVEPAAFEPVATQRDVEPQATASASSLAAGVLGEAAADEEPSELEHAASRTPAHSAATAAAALSLRWVAGRDPRLGSTLLLARPAARSMGEKLLTAHVVDSHGRSAEGPPSTVDPWRHPRGRELIGEFAQGREQLRPASEGRRWKAVLDGEALEVTELLERGERASLRGSAAHAQVVRRWLVVGLMDCAAILGLLFAFPDWGSWASSASSSSSWSGYSSSMPPVLVAGTGVVIAMAMVLPALWLYRRIILRSAKASIATLVLAAIVLVTAVAQASSIWVLLCFLGCGVLMAIVGCPLSELRMTE